MAGLSMRDGYIAAQAELIAATGVKVDERVLQALEEITRSDNARKELEN